MAAAQAGNHGNPSLPDLVHDLRSALSASTAYLDLARERLVEGEPVTEEDLALVERGLQRLAGIVERAEQASRVVPKPPEGAR